MSVSLAHEREVWVHTRDQKTGTTELRQYQSRYGSSGDQFRPPSGTNGSVRFTNEGIFCNFFWMVSLPVTPFPPIHEHWIFTLAKKKKKKKKEKEKKKKKEQENPVLKPSEAPGRFWEHLIRFLVLWVCVGTGVLC